MLGRLSLIWFGMFGLVRFDRLGLVIESLVWEVWYVWFDRFCLVGFVW